MSKNDKWKKDGEEDAVFIENSEELDSLSYSMDDGRSIFKNVNVTKKDFSLYELYRKYKKGQLVLDVDFQRREVWDTTQKNELIESILMGLPLPIFYFQQQDNAVYVVVDGKQRLSAIFQYFDNAFSLRGLSVLPFMNNKKYKDLEKEYGIYQSQFEDYQIYSHLILPSTPSYLIFDIFDRVNRGGTKLNKQEIRNALYHGAGLNMIDAVSRSQVFEDVTKIRYRDDKRMKGSYILTRFVSFFLYEEGCFEDISPGYQYDGNLDGLIENVLKYLNKDENNSLTSLQTMLESTLMRCNEILGEGAFRKVFNPRNPLNMNLFEAQMYLMFLIGEDGYNQIVDKADFRDKVNEVMNSAIFQWSIGDSRDSAEKVKRRFGMMRELAGGIV